MYEGKPKKSLNINWKSLLIKMAILLVVIFALLWIVSLFKKDEKNVESNLSVNLQTMKSAATDYFTGSRLPSNVNGKKKITLREMFDKKLVVEFRDQNNNSCDLIDSYAEATKLNDTDYTIKVKLVCGSESDYVINTVSFASEKPETPVDNNQDTNNTTDDNSNSTSTSTSTNNKPATSTNTNTNKKPSTSTNKKPTTSTSTSNINYVTTTKPNNNATLTNNCTYGDKNYTSTYPVAYIIPGNCAVSRNDFYKAEYANKVSSLSAYEYQKIVNEIDALKAKTGANLYVESPSYFGVYNKNNNGLVGYQILVTVKQKVNYATYTIYQYYLDQNGNRKAVIDKRNSLVQSNTTNNNISTTPSTIRVKSVELAKDNITLFVGNIYNASVTIRPTNATNKNVTWTSNNTRVATVDSNGKIIAKRAGVATITATADGISAKMIVNVYENKTYNYCKTKTQRVYSTGYIDTTTLSKYNNKTKSYDVVLKSSFNNVYDVEYGNLNTTSEYIDAYNYLVNKNKPLYLNNGSNGVGIDPGNGYSLRDHSLPNENYTPVVSYIGRNGSDLMFRISLTYKNVNYIYNRVPYYTSKNYGVFFTPLYFDVKTINTNDCETISSLEIDEFVKAGYVRY